MVVTGLYLHKIGQSNIYKLDELNGFSVDRSLIKVGDFIMDDEDTIYKVIDAEYEALDPNGNKLLFWYVEAIEQEIYIINDIEYGQFRILEPEFVERSVWHYYAIFGRKNDDLNDMYRQIYFNVPKSMQINKAAELCAWHKFGEILDGNDDSTDRWYLRYIKKVW